MKNIYFRIDCEKACDWGGFEKFYGKEIKNENSPVYYISMKVGENTAGYLNNEISAYFRFRAGKFFDMGVKNGAIADNGSVFFAKGNNAIKTCKKLTKKIEKKYPNKYNLSIETQC